MTDLDFATAISPQIGEFYATAKARRTIAPRDSLVWARSVGIECCDLIAERASMVLDRHLSGDERAAKLLALGLVDDKAKRLLDEIRRNGNQGAHPEKSEWAEHRLPKLAENTIKECLSLFKWMWARLHPQEPLPHFEMSQDDPGARQQICQRAALDGDAEAQHLMWQIMADKASGIYYQTRAVALENKGGVIGGPEHAKAVEHAEFWSKQAAEAGHPPAMHQHGLVLSTKEDKAEWERGVAFVRAAASKGEPDSIALIGCWQAYGIMGFELDYQKARSLFESLGSHPIALAQLGRLHLQGLGVERDEAMALRLTLQSAEAGFAEGQFEAFCMMARGQGCPADEPGAMKWLRLAADQGHLKALMTLARHLRKRRAAGDPNAASFEEIETLILQAMPDTNEAKLDMAQLFMDRGLPWDVVNAGSLLHLCRQAAIEENRSDVESACLALAPRVAKELELAVLTVGMAPNFSDHAKRLSTAVGLLYDERGFRTFDKGRAVPSAESMEDAHIAFGAKQLGRMVELILQKENLGRPAIANSRPRIERVATVRKAPKPGPNDPCHCGSGVKFKRCHGKG